VTGVDLPTLGQAFVIGLGVPIIFWLVGLLGGSLIRAM